ncbi:hypothetical protein CW736_03735 [Nonlabens sp. MB-3u-79]|jgi:hypothetical protein|uniref:hypothetical protein n=1 Tax=Nonlabens sp. MB-3u-79 TaxID=2058134 RepID=UPI000C30EA6F|nr:hypothetical protein [Nonlabens sp. MB-3u-79]AUC78561.1 hypothetical protein CW736_03735 [Nonlabens sp. MB-3u-79]|tara:strand:- start:12890 stop:13117 length:228 start_codon:yes stop_codon:yes gene_type:complete
MKKILVLLIVFSFPAFAKAQCAMCRAVIESSGDTAAAEGLNSGITYLMAFPYILVGAVVYIIYRSTQKNNQKVEG